jgi:tight adherence protein C
MNIFSQIFYQTQMDYLLVLILVFLTVSVLAGGLLYILMRQNFLKTRLGLLQPASTGGGDAAKPSLLLEQESQGLLASFSKKLAEMHNPKEEATVRELKLKLLRAGMRTRKAYRYYMASKVLAAFLLSGAYLARMPFYNISLRDLAICLLLFAAGFYLPELVIRHITSKRQAGMIRALPDALDLMVVCVESGLGLDMTFKRVGDELREIDKNLSEEFHLTTLETRAGKSRAESFKNMAHRTGISEISNLMTMLVQTARFGTSVADALRVHAEAMRTRRRQHAEEKAAQASVKITIPLILFILPALFIVLLGPAGINIAKNMLPAMGGGG